MAPVEGGVVPVEGGVVPVKGGVVPVEGGVGVGGGRRRCSNRRRGRSMCAWFICGRRGSPI